MSCIFTNKITNSLEVFSLIRPFIFNVSVICLRTVTSTAVSWPVYTGADCTVAMPAPLRSMSPNLSSTPALCSWQFVRYCSQSISIVPKTSAEIITLSLQFVQGHLFAHGNLFAPVHFIRVIVTFCDVESLPVLFYNKNVTIIRLAAVIIRCYSC